MKVYHASKFIIESPDIYHSRDLLDFGKGFYLTSLIEQAKKGREYAVLEKDGTMMHVPYCNSGDSYYKWAAGMKPEDCNFYKQIFFDSFANNALNAIIN